MSVATAADIVVVVVLTAGVTVTVTVVVAAGTGITAVVLAAVIGSVAAPVCACHSLLVCTILRSAAVFVEFGCCLELAAAVVCR